MRVGDSQRLSNGILKLAALNPAFGRLLGAIYVLIGVALLGRQSAGVVAEPDSGFTAYAPLPADDFFGFLSSAAGGMGPIVVALLLLGGIYGGADIKPDARSRERKLPAAIARLLVALAQTLAHLLAAAFAIWLALEIASDDTSILPWLLGLPLAFLTGATIGSTVFAFFMLLVHKVRGAKAQACSNQVFSGQSIPDYKNLLRMRLGADGSLTIHPLGVERACTQWELADAMPAPRFEPRAGKEPAVHAIDGPLEFDALGNRLA